MTTITIGGEEYAECSHLEFKQSLVSETLSLWIGNTDKIIYYRRKKPEPVAEKPLKFDFHAHNRLDCVFEAYNAHEKRLDELETAFDKRLASVQKLHDYHSDRISKLEQSNADRIAEIIRLEDKFRWTFEKLEQSAPQKQFDKKSCARCFNTPGSLLFICLDCFSKQQVVDVEKIREAIGLAKLQLDHPTGTLDQLIRDIEAALGEG